MPTHSGPNLLGEQNLVFGYNLTDQENSYRGEPTTNQANTDYARTIQFHNQEGYNNAGTISDAPEKGTDWKKIVITDRGNNFRIAQFPYIIQTYGTTKVYSVEYDFGLTSGYFFFGDGSSGFGVFQNDGKRVTSKFTPPYSSDWSEALFLGNYTPASGINDTIYYRYYQVEEKSYPTRYTPTSRSATQGLLDLTGNSVINLSSVSFDSNSQMTFDGTDDFITAGNNPYLAPGSENFTYSSWINPVGYSYYAGLLVVAVTGGLWIGKLGSNMVLRAYNVEDYLQYSTLPTVGQWTNVVITRNGTTVTLYYNANSVATATTGYNFVQATAYIGNDGPTSSANFNGKITNTFFFNRALTSTEITNNYLKYKRQYGLT